MNFEKKIALVTGGTRGIGAAISQSLKKKGFFVIANYHSQDQQAREFSLQNGINIEKWDVSNWEDCQNHVANIEETFGPIQVLVNNAGICRDATVEKMSLQQWHSVIDTNLNAVFYMSKAVIPSLKKQSYGRIINIGSINACRSAKGLANYSAAKAGVIGLSKALAHELAYYGITVNVIAPGYVRTQLIEGVPVEILEKIMKDIPLKRFGIPEEIASMVSFLTSTAASFITGTTIHLNGGQWMN